MLFYTSGGKFLCDKRGPSASQKSVFFISLLKRSQPFFFVVAAFTACVRTLKPL